MAASTRRIVFGAFVWLGIGALAWGVVAGVRKLSEKDPYSSVAELKKRRSDPSASIRADQVTMRHYANGKLVERADADHVIVSQDRRRLRLAGIKNGQSFTEQGAFKFEAGVGEVEPYRRRLTAAGGVHVTGQDLDIRSSQADIDGVEGRLEVPTPLAGKLMGGKFSADALDYRPNQSYTRLTNVVWVGKPPKSLEVPAVAQSRTWKIVSADTEQVGRTVTATDARADDGEVIVMAPKVVRDLRTDVLTATGRVTYRSAKADMVADKVVIFRKEGRAEFYGNVVMLVRAKKDWDKPLPTDAKEPLKPTVQFDQKGKPIAAISSDERKRDEELRSGKTMRDYPMNMTAEQVTYWYRKGERRAIAKGGQPTAWQKFDDGRWRQVWAPEARYDGEKDLLDLMGDPTKQEVKLKNSIGDDFKSITLRVSTREDQTEDDEYMKYTGADGIFIYRGDEDPRNETKPKTGGTGTTTPPVKTPPAKKP